MWPGIASALAGMILSACAPAFPPPRQAASEPFTIAVAGDSVPGRAARALIEQARARGWRWVSLHKSGCPVTGDHIVYPDGRSLASGAICPDVVAPHQRQGIARERPDVVLWWNRFEIADWRSPGGTHVRAGTRLAWRLRLRSIERVVDRLSAHGAHVVFVATEPPGIGIRSICTRERCNAWKARMVREYDTLTTRWNRMTRRWARAHPDRASWVSITDAVCARDRSPCDDRIDGVPARADGTHYTDEGIEVAGRALLDALEAVRARLERTDGADDPRT